MKALSYLIAFSVLFLTFNAQSQPLCSVIIDAPSTVISSCIGGQVNAIPTGASPYQYIWSSPTVSFSSITVADPFVSSSTLGWQSITVIVVDSLNCTSTITDSIQFIALIDTFYQTYCTLPDSVCVLDIPLASNLGWKYTDLSGIETTLASTNCVEIVGPGSYEFLGVYEVNCTVIHTYILEEDCGGVGIDEFLDKPEPFIYPNPATSEISVKMPSTKCDRWEIIDLFGKTHLSGSSDQSEFNIELHDIADGTYFIRIWKDDLVSNSVFIKE